MGYRDKNRTWKALMIDSSMIVDHQLYACGTL